MQKLKNLDRASTGFWFWLALGVVIFSLYSLTVAATTADDCGEGVDKEWVIFPPEWECKSPTGFG